MRYKVLVDTNILIGASIRFVLEDLPKPHEHQLYQDSKLLLSLFKKKLDDKIGILTHTVKDEAFKVLPQAVLDEIEVLDDEKREVAFKFHSILLDFCQDKLTEILEFLQLETPDEREVYQFFAKVSQMYNELMRTDQKGMGVAHAESRNLQVVARWVRQYQAAKQFRQIRRSFAKPVGEKDRRILAEAAVLLRHYKATIGDTTLYLASNDTTAFSPVRSELGIESDVVTRCIKQRFGVVCDHPRFVYKQLCKELSLSP